MLLEIQTWKFEKKPAFYAMIKLAFAENQRYTVCKR